MDMYRIHDMLENVSEAATTELAKGTENVNTKEFGDVIDMIKDLTEAEKNKAEACYYNTLIDAMEESEYGEDYDEYGPMERRGYRSRDSRGRYASRRNYPMNDKMWHDDRMSEWESGRAGYSNGAYGGGSRGMSSSGNRGMTSGSANSSRYGYSYDNYMRNRANYSMSDPEDKQERMKMLETYSQDLVTSISDVMKDVSPEEKTMLRNKLAKVVNTMQ